MPARLQSLPPDSLSLADELHAISTGSFAAREGQSRSNGFQRPALGLKSAVSRRPGRLHDDDRTDHLWRVRCSVRVIFCAARFSRSSKLENRVSSIPARRVTSTNEAR